MLIEALVDGMQGVELIVRQRERGYAAEYERDRKEGRNQPVARVLEMSPSLSRVREALASWDGGTHLPYRTAVRARVTSIHVAWRSIHSTLVMSCPCMVQVDC